VIVTALFARRPARLPLLVSTAALGLVVSAAVASTGLIIGLVKVSAQRLSYVGTNAAAAVAHRVALVQRPVNSFAAMALGALRCPRKTGMIAAPAPIVNARTSAAGFAHTRHVVELALIIVIVLLAIERVLSVEPSATTAMAASACVEKCAQSSAARASVNLNHAVMCMRRGRR
jgi:hypothetical protein